MGCKKIKEFSLVLRIRVFGFNRIGYKILKEKRKEKF